MAENVEPISTPESPMSKPSFCYAGDIYNEEQTFYTKLSKNALLWFEFPLLDRQEQWYLFRERGDIERTFGYEWKQFVDRINHLIKEQKTPPQLPIQTTPHYYG